MDADFAQSIVLITSQDLDNRNFGTGFVVHRHEQETVIVTCAHVINKVGGCEQVSIYGHTAKQIASGEAHNIDVAIVSVPGLSDRSPLSLCITGTTGDAFTTAGFQFFDQGFLLRPLEGTLGAEVGLEFRDQNIRIPAWDLHINEGNFDLQHGYSGSPVINPESACVLGVASHKLRDKKGLAISVKAIQHIWQDAPSGVFEKREAHDVNQKPFSRSAAMKREILTANLDDLLQKYKAAHAQIRSTLSDVDKITIKNRIRQLEQEIQETEQKLNSL